MGHRSRFGSKHDVYLREARVRLLLGGPYTRRTRQSRYQGNAARIIQLLAKPLEVCIIVVDGVRLDVANQSVLIDAAVVPFYAGPELEHIRMLLAMCSEKEMGMKLEYKEARFWKHLLPAFAERCHQWKHKSSCEYKVKGKIPVSSQPGERYMCSCGLGVFPKGYLKDVEIFTPDLAAHAVRVAIPVVYASPISPDVTMKRPGIPAKKKKPVASTKAQRQETVTPRTDDLSAKKNTCFTCGAKNIGKGVTLSRCGGCQFATYCSKDCQAKDWKAHKPICK
jgi:hypothetical protein